MVGVYGSRGRYCTLLNCSGKKFNKIKKASSEKNIPAFQNAAFLAVINNKRPTVNLFNIFRRT
jgi:hypothetical protein